MGEGGIIIIINSAFIKHHTNEVALGALHKIYTHTIL